MMNLGQRELYSQARRNYSGDIIRPDIGENIYRILVGPIRVTTAFYPTIIDSDEGSKQVVTAIVVPNDKETIFSKIAQAEKRVWMQLGQPKKKPSLEPSDRWFYLVFSGPRNNRKKDPETGLPKIDILSTTWTIYERLGQLEEEVSTKDKTKLRNGLIWMFDVIVKKTKDPRVKGSIYSIGYEAYAADGNELEGLIPATWLDPKEWPFSKIVSQIESNDSWGLFFSSEELEAWQSCSINLKERFAPMTDEQIAEALTKNPIDLTSDKLPDRELFLSELNRIELVRLTNGSSPAALPKTTKPSYSSKEEPVTEEPVTEEPPKESIVDLSRPSKKKSLQWLE